MTPRRRDDEPEFEEQFDDDVFQRPAARDDADVSAAPKRRTRASKAVTASPSRARRTLRVIGLTALALALVVFVVSFISGLGGDADERVTGDAQQGGARLDRIGPRLRVEVLNAGGVAGLARRATEHLRDRGFDVVAFGNAPESGRATTVVLARTSDVHDARAVAEALGTDSVEVDPDPQLYLDVTVHLGRDWPPVASPEQTEDSGFFGWFRGLFSSD